VTQGSHNWCQIRPTAICLFTWIHRTVANGLQTISTNFAIVFCTVKKWQCGVQFLLKALLDCINNQCWVTQSHAGNIPVRWVTSSPTWVIVISTKWSNCSHSTDFHGSSQNNVSGPTHFSLQRHQLAYKLSHDLAVPDYFLWGYVKSKVYEICPANTDDLKWQIRGSYSRNS
jgi:hypothetical protein